MPSIVSIIGKSKSGKTTLITALVPELKSRGYRVATIKHVSHKLTFDTPGKDSWRHIQAGSDATVIASLNQIVLIRPTDHEFSLDELTRLLGEDFDIIIAEGFKRSNAPKIEVRRKEDGESLGAIKNLIAIACDTPIETSVRRFSTQDIRGLADLLENELIKSKGNG